jgi:hypothetical protein
MKKLAIGMFLLAFVLFPFRPVQAASVTCEVVRRISGCDYFIVQTRTDYAILEWYGGHDPHKGDKLVGDINSYGFKDVRYESNDDKKVRVYVEDYGLSKTSALEKLLDKCE